MLTCSKVLESTLSPNSKFDPSSDCMIEVPSVPALYLDLPEEVEKCDAALRLSAGR